MDEPLVSVVHKIESDVEDVELVGDSSELSFSISSWISVT